jgi:hypothetical protein
MSRFAWTLACLPVAVASLLLAGGPARGVPAGEDADVTTQQQGPPGITAEAHYHSSIPGPIVEAGPSSAGFVASSVAATPVGADPETPEVSSVITGLPAYPPSTSSGSSGLAGPHACVQVKVGPIDTPACNPTPPGGGGQPGGGGKSGPGGNGSPPPSPEELAVLAADRAIAAAPRLRLRLAPSNVGLTGLESFFWLADRPRPITAVARVPGLTVVAEARPKQYVWHFGDGAEMVTVDPGTPWRPGRPGSIGHFYEVRGRYGVVVEAIWEARWRLGRGPWRSLGFFTTTGRRNYPVRQVVSRLVPGL